MITFIYYPKCSTCKRALKWLEDHQIDHRKRDIVLENPTKEELKSWYEENDFPLKKYFNTSGNLYKEKNLKENLNNMSEEEQLELLGSSGMLVRRPLIVTDKGILIGFKEKEYEEFFKE